MERKLTKPKLDDRMMSAASFVNRGDVVADVGTDHGYLPIYLILSGIIPFAVASDIREGPLGRARKNARKYGVDQKMKFELSDGLAFLEDGCPVDDIIICGMGGETIISIIEASDYPKKNGVRLILQPMTKAFELREYLYSGGFEIMDEMLSESGGKIYSCMLTRYTGKSRSVSFAAKMLGEKNIENRSNLFERYALSIRDRIRKQVRGMEKGGGSSAELKERLKEIEEIT
ncbi:MAG: SAM-dependent methyltransferase [Clostridia bacterium]|nr:SAM-dependent methyltransferase [Clostridia bacterium]